MLTGLRVSPRIWVWQQPRADRIFEVAESLDGAETLHRVTQGALLFHLWRAASDGPTRDVEAAVLGARLSAPTGFLPLSLVGFSALSVSGTAEQRLAGWIGGAHQAVLAALLHLDRVTVWQINAAQSVADLSGRTPALLVALLARWPMVSAPMAETETGASRAAVQRNLQSLTQRNLIREVTGQGRYGCGRRGFNLATAPIARVASSRAIVSPMLEGFGATVMPAASSKTTFSCALSPKALTIAPA